MVYASGKLFARYCLWAVRTAPVYIEGEAYIPTSSAVMAGWHTANLLAFGLHYHYFYQLPFLCLRPPGIIGVATRGKLEGFGVQAVELPADNTGNPVGALKYMLRALSEGKLVAVPVDGPYGPIYRIRPGALWLARASGTPLIPMGYAARPALRWLRWDHQLTPIPGSRIAAIFGQPIYIEHQQDIDDNLRAELGLAIDSVTQRAWEMVDAPEHQQFFSIPTSLQRRNQGDDD